VPQREADGQTAGYEQCRKRVCAEVAQHYLAERCTPPVASRGVPAQQSRQQVPLVVEPKTVAPFLAESGDLGRAALAPAGPHLDPRTRLLSDATGEPQCAPCHQQPESLVHLLHDCRELPAAMPATS
jgi:hypothetical protein